MAPITHQPKLSQAPSMDVTAPYAYESLHEKLGGEEYHNHNHHHDCNDQQCESQTPKHRGCHKQRLRRLLLPILLAFFGFIALLAVGCMADAWGLTDLGGEGGFMRRAVDAVANGQNGTGNGTFVNRKLYLIVVFVGLLVVLILAVMLSAWCCRGAFENPLCCPCYLCACCGGLACLECIGCGLCAEGVDQM